MTTIAAPHLPRHLIDRRRGNMEFNWGLTFVAALYLAVALVELSISVLAAPTITGTGSFYVTVPDSIRLNDVRRFNFATTHAPAQREV